MTAAVVISIVLYVIVSFAFPVVSRSFSVTTSLSNIFPSLLFSLVVITFSGDDDMFLVVSKVMVFFLVGFYFLISSLIILLKLGDWPVGWSSGIILVEMAL